MPGTVVEEKGSEAVGIVPAPNPQYLLTILCLKQGLLILGYVMHQVNASKKQIFWYKINFPITI